MLVQNYGWSTGPGKIWVWVASGQREARPLTLINPKSEFSAPLQKLFTCWALKICFQKMFIFIVKYDAKGVILWLQNYQH